MPIEYSANKRMIVFVAICAYQFFHCPAFAHDIATLEKLRSKKQFKEVLQVVDASLAKNPRNLQYVHYRMMALTALNRWQDLVDTLRKYIYLCESNAEKAYFHSLAADANMKLLDFAAAERDFEEQIKLKPEKRVSTLLRMGEAQLRQLKKDKAAKTLLSIDRKKLTKEDLEVRAKYLVILGRNKEALEDIERRHLLESKSYWYQVLKASVLIRMNRRSEAVAILRDVEKNAPDKMMRLTANYDLAEIADTAGSHIQHIIRLDEIDTANIDVKQIAHKAEYARQDERDQEALRYFDQIVKLQPFSANAIMRRAKVHLEDGRKKEGLADTNLAIEREADNSEPYQVRARFFLDEKKVDQGVNDWLTVLRLSPCSEHFLEVSRVYLQLNKPDQALKYADQGIALAPGKIKLHLARGLALLSLKKPTQALAEFSSVEKNPRAGVEVVVQRDMWVARAKAYRMLGKNALAEAEEKKVNTAQNDLFENAPFRNEADTASGAQKAKPPAERK